MSDSNELTEKDNNGQIPQIRVVSQLDQNSIDQQTPKKLNASLLRLKLLESLRNSDQDKLTLFFEEAKDGLNSSDPQISDVTRLILHYAVQVAPLSMVQFIASQKFVDDINAQDVDGNTPLHLAAHSSRYEIINYLMNLPTINDCIVNYSGKQAMELTSDLGIIQLMSDLRTKFVELNSNELRKAFESRNFDKLALLLSNQRVNELLDINGTDPITGDGVLHEFVRKDDLPMCKFILEHGGDPFKRNVLGKLPVDLASSSAMKKLLKDSSKEQSIIDPMGNGSSMTDQPPTYKGFLKKWTNFAGGYKLRWFVLDVDGRLSYYKSPNDINKNCRGAINLMNARLKMDSSEKSKFEIEIPSTTGTSIKWHLKSNHYIELNRWVWFLQNSIRYTKDLHRQQQQQQQQLAGSGNSVTKQQIQSLRNRESFDMSRKKDTSNVNQSLRTHQRAFSGGSAISVSSFSDTDSDPEIIKKKSRVKKLKSKLTPGGSNSSNKKLLEEIDENNRLRINKHLGRQSTNSSLRSSSIANSIKSSSPSGNFLSTGMDPMGDESDLDDDDEQEVDQETGDVIEKKSGPHGSHVTVLQNNLKIEISSLKEFIQNSATASAEDVITVSTNTLIQVENLLNELKQVLDQRDEKIQKRLSRQKEVSTLWENSIKSLEFEMREREQKIIALEDKQSHLKKILKHKFNIGTTTGNVQLSPDGLDNKAEVITQDGAEGTSSTDVKDEELAKFLEEDDDDSEDEFFDAVGGDAAATTIAYNVPPPSSSSAARAAEKIGSSGENDNQSEATLANSSNTSAALSKNGDTSSITKGKSNSDSKEVLNPLQKEKEELIEVTDESFKGYEDPIRTRLAMDEDNRPKISLWGILKSMVGKDMTKMTLPVSFNEPTSLLQRVAEDMEYTSLLDIAAAQDDSTLRMVYVAAFAASEYASTINRIAKPFNPLLGETYEYSRPDQHYRFLVEQVSHHPPISAAMAESKYWDYYGESFVKSKFYGRSFDIKPLGSWFLNMRPNKGSVNSKTGVTTKEELYTWKKVTSSVVGIIVGNPTIDNYGDMNITNHNTGDSLLFQFKARGWRESSAYEVKGTVLDSKKQPRWQIMGHWNSKIFAKRISSSSTEKLFLVWQANARPKIPFNLTEFATSLNAPQEHLIGWLPRTDTRFRPDQRAMEEGRYDDAALEKNRVEEKQRAAKKKREAKNETYSPIWFSKKKHPVTGEEFWHFNGEYWRKRSHKELQNVPDIF